MISLTRRFSFSASHRLHSDQLDPAGNRCTYGLCENIHGHNYRLKVTVTGQVDARTGFFCNVMELAGVVQRVVVGPCDHQYLNDLPLFAGVVSTMENLAGDPIRHAAADRVLMPPPFGGGLLAHQLDLFRCRWTSFLP